MEYLTQIVGKPVQDHEGERFGRIAELIVSPSEPLPVVSAFQVKTEDGAVFVPAEAMTISRDGDDFQLNRSITRIQQYMIGEHDFSLVRDVLDKQIVDVHDYRVVRVNDIRLEEFKDGRLALLGVDPGVRGLFRRLGVEAIFNKLQKALHLGSHGSQFIAWNDVESLPTHNAGEPLKLKVPHEKLSKLHPADIGDILNQLDPAHRKEVLESLDLETAADALAEADDAVQVMALRNMDEERAADILEEMPADEAADVLGDMDAAHREQLLGRMDADDREDVVELLEYHDKTAGGMMTNEFVAIKSDITAQETIDTLRALEPEAEMIYYVYVVDHLQRLVGVISLRDLIVAKPDARVEDFMIRSARSVPVDGTIEEVAHTFERYKLLALPVVDEQQELVGIITIDDTLEQLLPPDWRRRPHRRN